MTTDRDDPRLKEIRPDGQQATHIVLPEEDRKKGYVRPYRMSYHHVGCGPFCGKPHTNADGSKSRCTGDADHEGECMSWTDEDIYDRRNEGCGAITKMAHAIAETYATQPEFYGQTFCKNCKGYFPVGEHGEFVWEGTKERVGT